MIWRATTRDRGRGNMDKRAIIAAALALAVSGCVNVEATRLSAGQPLAPLAASQVTIYLSPDKVPGSYKEIALLEANGDGNATTERDFYESMRKKAAKLGANGVILEPGLEPGPTLKIAASLLDINYTRYRHAVAVLVDRP